MKVKAVQFPKESNLEESNYDYYDSFKATYSTSQKDINIVEISKVFFSSTPSWMRELFEIRNKVVTLFGLKTPDSLDSKQELLDSFKGEPGESLGFFKVYQKTENEVILGEDDKHLDFRVSLLKNDSDHQNNLIVTTTVTYNNWFGKVYFFFVKPFHKLIVPSMTKGIVKQLKKTH